MTDQIGADPYSAAQPGKGRKAGARFGGFVRDNGYLWLAFFASAALMLFMWFCNQMIPFGGRTILRMDLYHQYGPLFAELYERLIAGRSLLYSWNTGLGGGFLGNFFNYLSSPTGLLVLLFGHEKVPEAIGVMVLLKCAFASGAFAWMLRKVHGRNDASIAAFGVLYSFCSFFIAYYWNVMWIDGMALLPLIMLGIWYIVRQRKFMFYTVTLALALVTNYFMGYMLCIFSVLFFLVAFFSGGAEDALPQFPPPGKKRIKDNRFLRTGFVFAYASILAAALAAFALVPVYMTLRGASATSGTFPKDISTNFKIFDFLANHFADVNPTIRSSGEDVLPNVYCGVATILLVPLYLFVPKIKAREKAAHLLLLLVMYFSFNTNVLNYVWHAFHFPNDLPYRFSFLYSFLLLWIAYKVFLNLRDVPLRAIVGVGAAAALFVVVVEKIGSKNVDYLFIDPITQARHENYTTYITLAFLVAYTLIFAALRKSPKPKSVSLTMVLLCCVITEVCAADVKNFEITQLKENFTTDLRDFQQVKKELYESDGSFFRMELTDHRTRTDPAWYDYRGASTFSSMAYERTANLQSRLGLGSNFINSYTYNPNTAVYNAMHNLKYIVENMSADPDGSFVGPHGSSFLPELESSAVYAKRDEFTRARFTVFENKYYLPIGFWANNALRGWNTSMGSNPFRVQGEFWELAGGGAGVFEPLALRISDDYYGDGGFNAYTSEQW
ncbi:MAG: YfhO family protein, partial [Firmicutes bacterium]|nr:YfhO family protein [Bacillota bacterium]